MYGNFRKCGTRFYPVRSGAVRYKVLVMAQNVSGQKQNRNREVLNTEEKLQLYVCFMFVVFGIIGCSSNVTTLISS